MTRFNTAWYTRGLPFRRGPPRGLRIPMKWGTDSDEVGQHQGEATLVMAMITEVPHFSQVFLLGEG